MDVVNAFNPTDDPLDGIAKLSAEWILKNMPELSGINFTMYGPGCMSNAIVVAAQAIGDGLAHTCLVLKGWHNLAGRYYQGGAAAMDTVAGNAWGQLWGTRAGTTDAFTFQEYLHKYNKTHDMMANFIVNSKKNGLMFPEGFFAQNRPDEITREDYINARWIVKPLNLFDMDIPIMATAAYLFTTAERAQDMAQNPVYILNHCTTRPKFGLNQGLENAMLSTEATARKSYSGAGITASDLSFENMYDGFTVFHNHYLEGLRYGGMKRGEVLDFYESEDISISGPHPVSPSGGNCGSGPDPLLDAHRHHPAAPGPGWRPPDQQGRRRLASPVAPCPRAATSRCGAPPPAKPSSRGNSQAKEGPPLQLERRPLGFLPSASYRVFLEFVGVPPSHSIHLLIHLVSRSP